MRGPYNYIALTTSDERLAATFSNAINAAGDFDSVLEMRDGKYCVICPGQCVSETADYFRGFRVAFGYLYQDPSTKR